MNQAKFYKTLVIILVVLNLGTLFFMWFNKPPHRGRPEHTHISTMLKLKGDVKQTVDEISVAHHKEKRTLIQEDKKLHDQLYMLIGKKADAAEILEKIHFNKVKIEAITFKYFDEVAKNCNETQLLQLQEFIKKALNNLSVTARKGPPGKP